MIRLTPAEQKVYVLLRSGAAQSLIVRKTGLLKGTVSKIASRLVRDGFVSRVTNVQPYLYGQGPRSGELDALIDAKEVLGSATDEVSSNGTGVNQVSPAHHGVKVALTHHIPFRFHVVKIGDTEIINVGKGSDVKVIPFLENRPYFDRRNVKRTKGKLHGPSGTCSVELEETPKVCWFKVWLPELNLTKEELPQWETLYTQMAVDNANYLQKWAGWQFGVIELMPGWKPHLANIDPRVLGVFADKYTGQSASGKVWLSDSGGRRELETSDAELASVIMELPEEVLNLKVRMVNVMQMLDMIATAEERRNEIEVTRLERETVLNGFGVKN